MANEQNLRPISALSKEEQWDARSRGGKKSGEVRRQKRTFAELINSYLDRPITNNELKEKLKSVGFTDEELINKNVVVFAQFKEAMKGNTQSAIFIRDSAGEKPVEQVQNLTPPTIKLERPNE